MGNDFVSMSNFINTYLPDHLFLHAIYNEVIVSSVEMVTQTIWMF